MEEGATAYIQALEVLWESLDSWKRSEAEAVVQRVQFAPYGWQVGRDLIRWINADEQTQWGIRFAGAQLWFYKVVNYYESQLKTQPELLNTIWSWMMEATQFISHELLKPGSIPLRKATHEKLADCVAELVLATAATSNTYGNAIINFTTLDRGAPEAVILQMFVIQMLNQLGNSHQLGRGIGWKDDAMETLKPAICQILLNLMSAPMSPEIVESLFSVTATWISILRQPLVNRLSEALCALLSTKEDWILCVGFFSLIDSIMMVLDDSHGTLYWAILRCLGDVARRLMSQVQKCLRIEEAMLRDGTHAPELVEIVPKETAATYAALTATLCQLLSHDKTVQLLASSQSDQVMPIIKVLHCLMFATTTVYDQVGMLWTNLSERRDTCSQTSFHLIADELAMPYFLATIHQLHKDIYFRHYVGTSTSSSHTFYQDPPPHKTEEDESQRERDVSLDMAEQGLSSLIICMICCGTRSALESFLQAQIAFYLRLLNTLPKPPTKVAEAVGSIEIVLKIFQPEMDIIGLHGNAASEGFSSDFLGAILRPLQTQEILPALRGTIDELTLSFIDQASALLHNNLSPAVWSICFSLTLRLAPIHPRSASFTARTLCTVGGKYLVTQDTLQGSNLVHFVEYISNQPLNPGATHNWYRGLADAVGAVSDRVPVSELGLMIEQTLEKLVSALETKTQTPVHLAPASPLTPLAVDVVTLVTAFTCFVEGLDVQSVRAPCQAYIHKHAARLEAILGKLLQSCAALTCVEAFAVDNDLLQEALTEASEDTADEEPNFFVFTTAVTSLYEACLRISDPADSQPAYERLVWGVSSTILRITRTQRLLLTPNGPAQFFTASLLKKTNYLENFILPHLPEILKGLGDVFLTDKSSIWTHVLPGYWRLLHQMSLGLGKARLLQTLVNDIPSLSQVASSTLRVQDRKLITASMTVLGLLLQPHPQVAASQASALPSTLSHTMGTFVSWPLGTQRVLASFLEKTVFTSTENSETYNTVLSSLFSSEGGSEPQHALSNMHRILNSHSQRIVQTSLSQLRGNALRAFLLDLARIAQGLDNPDTLVVYETHLSQPSSHPLPAQPSTPIAVIDLDD